MAVNMFRDSAKWKALIVVNLVLDNEFNQKIKKVRSCRSWLNYFVLTKKISHKNIRVDVHDDFFWNFFERTVWQNLELVFRI